MTGASTAPAWADRQRAFAERMGRSSVSDLERGTIVVVPSATFPVAELRKITGIQYYEERLLFTTLLLRRPELRLVYVSSMPVDEAIVEYYLRFVPDPAGARRRLTLLTLGDPSPLALSEKLLHRPDVVGRMREAAGPAESAYVLSFNVTRAEHALADALGLPIYGPHPDLVPLGSKTGSRRVARRAGVAVLAGDEALFSLDEVARALRQLRAERPGAEAAVIKLNDGFSGQGNAIVDLDGLASPLPLSPTVFCAAEESWPSFGAKIAQGGAIVEELVHDRGATSPSVQVRIAPTGTFEVVSTHDQVLGGPRDQVYLGCRFPAHPDYRLAIQEAAVRVAEVLAAEGVIGSFGIDFLVVPADGGPEIFLSEINLRMGGTTHPFWMARLATGGTYDDHAGELVVVGAARTPKAYMASDNLKSPGLVGRRPAEVIDAVDRAGLGYDQARAAGATLHLLGALPQFGKMGATCIADGREDADALYRELLGVLGA